ncbi:RidA family protein [Actinopolymorpha alba]|uniref:RidA family protein n=1 Tax=Actinopolymorpha alba TaxID=533267 RepID=UPI00036617A8|nr:RidA family protein [Actinopolymorpha alba]
MTRDSIDDRLKMLGITLPSAAPPAASYVNAAQTGNLLFLSGKGPAPSWHGRLGREYTTEQGQAAAREAGLQVLATVTAELGSLNRVVRVVKAQGFVLCTPDFEQPHAVLDGFSDLMVEVFGEAGRHARSVFGAAALRQGVPIIVDSVFEVSPLEQAPA